MRDDEFDRIVGDDYESTMGSMDPGRPNITGRKVAGKAARLAMRGTRSTAASIARTLGSQISKELPNTASAVRDLKWVVNDIADLRKDIGRRVGPGVVSIRQSSARILTRLTKSLPASLQRKVEGLAKAIDVPTEAQRASDEEALRDSEIASELNRVFRRQSLQQEVKAEEDRLNTSLDRNLASVRHESLMRPMMRVALGTERLVHFHSTTHLAWMRKSLELQYRQLHTSKDLYGWASLFGQMVETKLEEIKHNTGLPEIRKQTLADQALAAMRQVRNSKLQNYFSSITSHVKKQVVDSLGGLVDMASDMASGVQMMGDVHDAMSELDAGMDEAMGITKSPAEKRADLLAKHGGTLAGWLLGTKLGEKYMPKVAPLIREADKTFSNFQTKAAMRLENYRRRHSGDFGWRGLVADVVLPPLRSDSEDEVGENTGFSGLTTASKFDNAAHRSLVEVIPGFLGKILQGVTNLVFKTTDAEEMVYDPFERDFTTASGMRQIYEHKLLGKPGERSHRYNTITGVLRAKYGTTTGGKTARFDEHRRNLTLMFANLSAKMMPFDPAALYAYDRDEIEDEDAYVDDYIRDAFQGMDTKERDATVHLLVQLIYGNGDVADDDLVDQINQQYLSQAASEDYQKLFQGVLGTGHRRLVKDLLTGKGTLNRGGIAKLYADTSSEATADSDETAANLYRYYSTDKARHEASLRETLGDRVTDIYLGKEQMVANRGILGRFLNTRVGRVLAAFGVLTATGVRKGTRKLFGENAESWVDRHLESLFEKMVGMSGAEREDITSYATSLRLLVKQKIFTPDLYEKFREIEKLLKEKGLWVNPKTGLVETEGDSLTGELLAGELAAEKTSVETATSVQSTEFAPAVPTMQSPGLPVKTGRRPSLRGITKAASNAVGEKVKTLTGWDLRPFTSKAGEAFAATKGKIFGKPGDTVNPHESFETTLLRKLDDIIANLKHIPDAFTDGEAAKASDQKRRNLSIREALNELTENFSYHREERKDADLRSEEVLYAIRELLELQLGGNGTITSDELQQLASRLGRDYDRAKAWARGKLQGGRSLLSKLNPLTLFRSARNRLSPLVVSVSKRAKQAGTTLLGWGKTGGSWAGKKLLTGVKGIKKTLFGYYEEDDVGFFDVYLKDNIVVGYPLLSAQTQEEGVFFTDGQIVERTQNIVQPVVDKDGNVLITAGHIAHGLVDIDGNPITEKRGATWHPGWLSVGGKYGKAGAKRTASFLNRLGSGVSDLLFGAKEKYEPFIHIYRKGFTDPGRPLLSKHRQEEGVYFRTGTRVERSADITQPVYATDAKRAKLLITAEDIEHGLVDINGAPITEHLPKGQVGGIAKPILKGIGGFLTGTGEVAKRGILGLLGVNEELAKKTIDLGHTAIKGVGAGVKGIWDRLLGKGIYSDKLQESVDRLYTLIDERTKDLDIYIERSMPRAQSYDDWDGDGFREGGYHDRKKRRGGPLTDKDGNPIILGPDGNPMGGDGSEGLTPAQLAQLAKRMGKKGGLLEKGANVYQNVELAKGLAPYVKKLGMKYAPGLTAALISKYGLGKAALGKAAAWGAGKAAAGKGLAMGALKGVGVAGGLTAGAALGAAAGLGKGVWDSHQREQRGELDSWVEDRVGDGRGLGVFGGFTQHAKNTWDAYRVPEDAGWLRRVFNPQIGTVKAIGRFLNETGGQAHSAYKMDKDRARLLEETEEINATTIEMEGMLTQRYRDRLIKAGGGEAELAKFDKLKTWQQQRLFVRDYERQHAGEDWSEDGFNATADIAEQQTDRAGRGDRRKANRILKDDWQQRFIDLNGTPAEQQAFSKLTTDAERNAFMDTVRARVFPELHTVRAQVDPELHPTSVRDQAGTGDMTGARTIPLQAPETAVEVKRGEHAREAAKPPVAAPTDLGELVTLLRELLQATVAGNASMGVVAENVKVLGGIHDGITELGSKPPQVITVPAIPPETPRRVLTPALGLSQVP